MKDIRELEKGPISIDTFMSQLDQQTDKEIMSQIEHISRSLLQQINSLTTSEAERVFSRFSSRLLALFKRMTSKNIRFLVALIQKNYEHLIQNADVEPQLAIRWLSSLDPSLNWIVPVSRKSNVQLYDALLQIDPELIAQKPDTIRSMVNELNGSKINSQQNELLFKVLTRCFVKHSELIELVSNKLKDTCSRLPITSNLEVSVSFLTVLRRHIDSTDIGKKVAKELEEIYLREKKHDKDDLLERGLNLFLNKTLPAVTELIPLLAFEKYKDSLMRILSSMSDEALLRGVFENPHLCLRDHAGLDEFFQAASSLVYSIPTINLSETEILDGNGIIRRISNSWLMMIPPRLNPDRMRQLPPKKPGMDLSNPVDTFLTKPIIKSDIYLYNNTLGETKPKVVQQGCLLLKTAGMYVLIFHCE